MIWESLSKLALLGTSRSFLEESLEKDFRQKGIDLTAPLAKIVLQAAALHQVMQKAGFPLEEFSNAAALDLPTIEEKSCSARSTHHLNLILNGTYPGALAEFTFHLQRQKRIFPPVNLPGLFEECLSKPELWEKIKPLIGQRGKWLLMQNPAWETLWPVDKLDLWDTGSRSQRAALFTMLRQQKPETAFALLEKSWKQEDPAAKKAFLKALEINLNPKEEPFLENGLDDRRKEVRQTAAHLLMKMGTW